MIALLGLVGWLGLAGCGRDPVASYATETDPAQLFLSLTLEARAITLDTATGYNTLQLTATPRNGRGEPMAGLPAPTFRLATVGDSANLRVTPEGLITGLNTGSNLNVIAELAVPGPDGYPVRHADTARVTVTTTPPQVLASLSIHPVSPDSAMVPVYSGAGLMWSLGLLTPTSLKPVALDAVGQPISGVVVEYSSLDPTIATVKPWSGEISPRVPGRARLVARATVSGITRADTAVFTMTWPVEQQSNIEPGPDGPLWEASEIRIVPYGVVEWNNYLSDSVDIVFDDPTNVKDPVSGSGAPVAICNLLESVFSDAEICADGNILIPGVNFSDNDPSNDFSYRYRQFPVPGVYRFHSTRTGLTGQVVVSHEIP